MGAPVVFPSKIPESISTASSSFLCVTYFEVPGFLLSKSICKSFSSRFNPGGHPSTTPPIAGPCDSPKEVRENNCPKVLPDIKLPRFHY